MIIPTLRLSNFHRIQVHLTPDSSPELTKKSWFGSLMTTEKDETFTILVKGKPLASVKADLIHAFLSVSVPKLIISFGISLGNMT